MIPNYNCKTYANPVLRSNSQCGIFFSLYLVCLDPTWYIHKGKNHSRKQCNFYSISYSVMRQGFPPVNYEGLLMIAMSLLAPSHCSHWGSWTAHVFFYYEVFFPLELNFRLFSSAQLQCTYTLYCRTKWENCSSQKFLTVRKKSFGDVLSDWHFSFTHYERILRRIHGFYMFVVCIFIQYFFLDNLRQN